MVKFRFLYTPLLLISAVLFCACKKDYKIIEKQLVIEPFVKNLELPWGMAFLPNGDFIFCERHGRISLLKKGEKIHTAIMYRPVQTVSEGGLLGLAIDPDFTSNHYIFIYETLDSNHVVRLKLENDVLTEDKIIVSNIPQGLNHDGGGLKFGPDGYLYIGTGDALLPNIAQDKNSLGGKILRVDRDGKAPPGNPFNSRVWSYGHRNVQGFDWMANGVMIATEHGPSSEFGWCCHDEINYIQPGKNYGWPLVYAGNETDTLTPPLFHSGFTTWAPSGCTFIKGQEWGAWENNLLVGALKAQKLIRFQINNTPAPVAITDTLAGVYLRLRNVIQASDGSVYFNTSNVGYPSIPQIQGDDKIYKMYWK